MGKLANRITGLAFAGLLAATSLVHSNANDNGIHFYLGVNGGCESLDGRYLALNPVIGETHFATIGNKSGFIGGVLGAQTYLCQNFFIALQGNALYNTLDAQVRKSTNTFGVPNHVVKVKNSLQYGLDARLGFRFCEITPYILGGFEAGKWTMTLANESTAYVRGIPPYSRLSFSKTLWGPKVGIGLSFPIYCSLIANLEYSYTWFGRVSAELVDIPTAVLWHHRERIDQNSFTAGLNYLF